MKQTQIDKVMNDPSVHYFTKDIITRGLKMDCVDAYYDVKLALEVLQSKLPVIS